MVHLSETYKSLRIKNPTPRYQWIEELLGLRKRKRKKEVPEDCFLGRHADETWVHDVFGKVLLERRCKLCDFVWNRPDGHKFRRSQGGSDG